MLSNQQRSYTFPTRQWTDIMLFMRNIQISVTEDELKEGNRSAVRRVFEQLLDLCMDISKDQLSQPVFAGRRGRVDARRQV